MTHRKLHAGFRGRANLGNRTRPAYKRPLREVTMNFQIFSTGVKMSKNQSQLSVIDNSTFLFRYQ